MGARADFYVGRGEQAEWLGSIAWDGYPSGVPMPVLGAATETLFRQAVEEILATEESATRPDQGWPWPWEDSRTTDFSYAWDALVYVSCFGHEWQPAAAYDPDREDAGKTAVFPRFGGREQRVDYGRRSGAIFL